MAKKKESRSALPKQEKIAEAHEEVKPAMDSEPSEKLESLKSLNRMLLKETVERRQQVESLVQSKGCLETALARTNSEKEGLESEVTHLVESAARLDLERSVMIVVVGFELGLKGETIGREMSDLKRVIGERESEIERLSEKLSEMECVLGNEKEVSKRACFERDEMKCNLDLQMEDGRELISKLVQSEERKGLIEQALVELRDDYDGVVREKREMEMVIKNISGEKESVERCLVESNMLAEEMKENARVSLDEKRVILEEKAAEVARRLELEDNVSGLHEMVAGLQKEEVKLVSIVADLEKKCFAGEERQKELVEENKSSEEKIKNLIVEKATVEGDLGEALKLVEEEKRKSEAMVNENVVMVEAKRRLESEVSDLKKQVVGLECVVLKLEESNRVEVEKIKSLESEVGCNLELLKTERSEMQNLLDEERENGVRMKEKIGALEDKIVEKVKLYEKVKTEKASVFAEKLQLENHCGMLKKEITRLEGKVTDVQNEFDGMKSEAEMAAMVLKETAAVFCLSDDVKANGEVKKVSVAEVEMIKNAFEDRDSKIDNMKKLIDLLEKNVEDARKKKSLWTMLSSVTTLFAAVSMAYIARGH